MRDQRPREACARQSARAHLSVNLTTLHPGAWLSQRHWHEKEDEFVYVPAPRRSPITATSILSAARKAVASSSPARTASPTHDLRRPNGKGAVSWPDRPLPLDRLAAARRELPALAVLLGLCAQGHRNERCMEGRLARTCATLPLPSLGQPRLRPGTRLARGASPLRALALRPLALKSNFVANVAANIEEDRQTAFEERAAILQALEIKRRRRRRLECRVGRY